MKKIYSLFWAAVICAPVFGQVTIQASELNAVIGESFTSAQVNWVSEGSAGNNVVWDFSSVQPTGTMINYNHTAGSATFPSSNITQQTTVSGQTSEIFYEMSSAGQFYHGINLGGSIIMTYQDPAMVMTFPLNNMVNETDNFSATFTSGGFPFTRAGTSNVLVDGWGTLITPEGTFTNVIRVKNEMDYTDTFSGGTITYNTVTYAWYKAGVHFALAAMSETTTSQSATQYSGQYLTDVVLNLNENVDSEITLSPNPVSGELTIKTSNGDAVKMIEIINMSGVKVQSNEIGSGILESTIDVSGIERGSYIVLVLDSDGNQLEAKKIIKN